MNRMILEFSRIQTLAGITRSAYNQYTPIAEDMRNPPSALLWKQATEHFHDLGNPDKFVGDRAQSEWTSFTVTTSSHELINEMSRITKQLPGNALNMFVDSNVLLSIVVHHQPHYHAQTRDHGQRRKFDSQPHALRLAFISQFAELPFDMVFTEQHSVRCAQVAVYKFLGIPEDKLTKMHHYEKDPKVLAKAAVTMFR
ncbi:MAG: oleate hydratase [Rhodococcus sp. (in: high G+C Gram-positive bacteria)]|uniref:oleate hydratase n=1 Tax=Rhodococcus sp. TaxID=1831 RepID=UPI002AD76C09|nr:oleate hydratase [Rhodococcus sp. (in: high G+C Gram-positive bacteria)]